MATYKCENVGAGHFSGTIEAENDDDLLKQVGRHLGSKDYTLTTEDGGDNWTVLVGMFRPAGTVVRQ